MTASKNSGLGLSAGSDSEGVKDLEAKRREIERTLKDQFKTQAQTQPGLGFGSSGLEAALTRMGKRNGEGTILESVDDEMVDVSELVELGGVLEENLQGRMNLSYSEERCVTRNFRIRETTRILTNGNIARRQSSRNTLVSFLPKRTTLKMQTTDNRCSG